MKAKAANESRAYLRFKREIAQALEVLLNKAHQRVTDELRGAFSRAMEIVAYRYTLLSKDQLQTGLAKQALRVIDSDIDQAFQVFGQNVTAIMVRLSKNAQTLALVGEAEAIGRAQGKPAKYSVDRAQLLKVALKGRDEEILPLRVMLAFDRLRRKLLNAIELSMIQSEDTREALERALRALPSKRVVKRPKRVLKVQEADIEATKLGKKQSLSVGFVTDEDWADVVNEYMTTYVPRWRGPETVFDLPDPEGGEDLEERYGWEIEQELTDKFVRDVRAGQNEAAKQNGVTDLIWIAIVDDKTDQCCAWRNGLTSEEIERELKGVKKDDECQAIVPPAHFNCRCDSAPMLKDWPEVEPSNLQEFEDWLNS